MKIKRIILFFLAAVIFFSIFLFDIIRKTHDPTALGTLRIRQLVIVVGFLIIYFLLNRSEKKKEKSIVNRIGNVLIISASILVSFGSVMFLTNVRFTIDKTILIPSNYFTVIHSNFISIITTSLAIYLLIFIKNLIFSYRRKETKRNFVMLLILIFATTFLYFYYAQSDESSAVFLIVYIITIILMVVNSFKLPWIVYLSRKEKYYTIAYCLILLPLLIVSTVINNSSLTETNSSLILLYFSPVAKEFVFLMTLFGSIYLGMAFISTIFHIPTQDIFDRKIVEISSLHNLSRLVTQVFDFKDLIENITKLALGVCEANCAWIEIRKENKGVIYQSPDEEKKEFELVGVKNISIDEINVLYASRESPFHKELSLDRMDRKIIYIGDLAASKEMSIPENLYRKIKSLVVVPLISHSELIGILYIGKSFAYGFDKEYLNIITTFADQVTISIENSKLIEKSIEKERMERELLLAQKMQRQLLPHSFPVHKNIDLCAISIPAYEVGGDYYDFSQISEDKLGIIVGDVSGKGISAAFYMALMKGIFQALSKVFNSPKDFLIKANLSLKGHLDKKSFVSLIYGVIDLKDGKLYLSRAGHCPMILLTENEAKFIKPEGLGVGLDNGKIFDNITEEIELELENDAICIFYTDGFPEARNKTGQEFGYRQLLESIKWSKDRTAFELCNEMLSKIKGFTQSETEYDDLTIVIFRWKGNGSN